jgi:hypothetical protein
MGFGVLKLSKAESKLRIITTTPSYNPNYFFPDYQRAGDVYSLPQAHTHQTNWGAISKEANVAGVEIFNLSHVSRLKIFKKRDIHRIFDFISPNCWDNFVDPFKDVLKVDLGETANSPSKQPVASLPSKTMAPFGEFSGLGFRVQPSPYFAQTSPNQWRYTRGNEPQKIIWVAMMGVHPETAGHGFVGACACSQTVQ